MAELPVRQRVVEVETDLGEGSSPRYRYGSGLLIGERQVLTAAHVVSGAAAVSVRSPEKVRLAANLDTALVGDPSRLDLALLEVPEAEVLPQVEVAVVDRDVTGGEVIENCWAVGYPEFAEVRRVTTGRSVRETKEVHGSIAPLSGLVEGLLSLEVTSTPRPLPTGALDRSEWSGMSGAAVFAGSRLLGVVAEHAPRRGSSDITLTPLDVLINTVTAPPGAASWLARLGIRDPQRVHLVGGTETGLLFLAERLEIVPIPNVVDAQTMDLTDFGVAYSAIAAQFVDEGARPPYVQRGDVEERITHALVHGGIVVIRGQSKAGKSRTALEAALRLPADTLVVVPRSTRALDEVLADTTGALPPDVPILVWLDGLDRFLGADGVERRMLKRLDARTTFAAVLATVQTDRYAKHQSHALQGLDPAFAAVLNWSKTTFIDLLAEPSAAERDGFAAAYPGETLSGGVGIAEHLIAAQVLVDRLNTGDAASPYGMAVVRAAVDWQRAGLAHALPESALARLVDPYLDARLWPHPAAEQRLEEGIDWAATPIGQAASLIEIIRDVEDPSRRLFKASDYVVAYEESATDTATGRRSIPVQFWHALVRCIGDELNADDAFAIARAADQEGNIDIAEAALRSSTGTAGGQENVLAWFLLGRIQVDQGKAAEAAETYRRALVDDSEAADAARVNLASLIENEDPDEAKRLLREAGSRPERLPGAASLLNLGIQLESEGQLDEAEKALRTACSGHDTVRPQVLAQLGRLLEAQGRDAEAREILEEAAALEGDLAETPMATLALGRLLAHAGVVDQAEALFLRAASAADDESRTAAKVELGELCFRHGRAADGERLFAELLEAEEARPGVHWFRLGTLRESVGDSVHARNAFEHAAEVGDDEVAAGALYRLASLLADDGRLEDAVAAYEDGLRRTSFARPLALLGLAETLLELGRSAAAEMAARDGLESAEDPVSRSALALVLGRILRRSERSPEARPFFELAASGDSIAVTAQAHLELAHLAMSDGDLDRAAELLQAATIDPETEAGARVLLGKVRYMQERGDEALEAFADAITKGNREEVIAARYWRGLLYWNVNQISDSETELAYVADSADAELAHDAGRALRLLRSGAALELFFTGVDEDEPLVPLVLRFYRQTEVDAGWLERRFERLPSSLGPRGRLSASDVVTDDEPEIVELWSRLHERVANVTADPYWSPAFETSLRELLADAERLQAMIGEGISAIVNELLLARNGGAVSVATSVHWFTRMVRSELLRLLYMSQSPDNPDLIEPDAKYISPWSETTAFYGISGTMQVVVARMPADSTPASLFTSHLKAVIPRDSWVAQKLREDGLVRATLVGSDELARFVIPQAVFSWLKRSETMIWDFDDVVVGIA